MLRITLVSLVILPLLLWFAFQARNNDKQLLSTGLFSAVAVYVLLLIGSFAGVVGG